MSKYISLHYKTSTWDSPSSTCQCNYFSSMIKNKIDNYAYIKFYRNPPMYYSIVDSFKDGYCYKGDLKEAISKNSCIPYMFMKTLLLIKIRIIKQLLIFLVKKCIYMMMIKQYIMLTLI